MSLLAGLLSLGWLGLSGFYILSRLHSDTLLALQPAETGGLIALLCLPLLTLWGGVAGGRLLRRTRHDSAALRMTLEQLMFPSSQSELRVHRIASSLKEQTALLEAAAVRAQTLADSGRVALETQAETLNHWSSTAQQQMTALSSSLTRDIAGLEDRCTAARSVQEELRTLLAGLDLAGSDATRRSRQFADTMAEQISSMNTVFAKAQSLAEATGSSLHSGIDALQRGLDQAGQRLDALHAVVSDQSALLGELVDGAQSRAESVLADLQQRVNAVDGLFTRQNDAMAAASLRLSEQGERMGALLEQQAISLDQVIERVTARVRIVEEGLSVQTRDLSAVSDHAVSRFRELNAELSGHGDVLRAVVVRAGQDVRDFGGLLRRQGDDVTAQAERSQIALREVGATAQVQGQALASAADQLVSRGQDIGSLLRQSGEELTQGVGQLAEQTELARAALRRQGEDITALTSLVSAQVRLSEAALAQQTRHLNSNADQIAARIKGVSDLLRQNSAELMQASEKITQDAHSIGDTLRQRGDDVASIAGQAVETLGGALNRFDEHTTRLRDILAMLVQQSAGAQGDLQRQAADLVSMAEQTQAGIRQAGEGLGEQSQRLGRVAEDCAGQVRLFADDLRQAGIEIQDLTHQSESLLDRSRLTLHHSANELEAVAGRVTAQLSASGATLGETMDQTARQAGQVGTGLQTVSDQLRQQTADLIDLSDKTGSRLQTMTDATRQQAEILLCGSDQLQRRTEELLAALAAQTADVSAAAEKAGQQTQALIRQRAESSADRFLHLAAHIIETLNALGVDISRLYQPDLDERVWREFHAGDQSVFVRKILRTLDRSQISAIRSRYESNSAFRDYVTRYLSEFEGLLKLARASDRPDLLVGIMTSSEVGKLYLVLARAMGRFD